VTVVAVVPSRVSGELSSAIGRRAPGWSTALLH
jgi:hypothetical protein